MAGLAGCYARASAAPSISLSTAYVPQPTVPGPHRRLPDHPEQRRPGPADQRPDQRRRPGHVRRADGRGGSSSVTHPVPSIPVPADSVVRLIPVGLRLLITGAGQLRGGKDITLTLTFAHAGAVSVTAQVTNPQTGGSSYFLN